MTSLVTGTLCVATTRSLFCVFHWKELSVHPSAGQRCQSLFKWTWKAKDSLSIEMNQILTCLLCCLTFLREKCQGQGETASHLLLPRKKESVTKIHFISYLGFLDLCEFFLLLLFLLLFLFLFLFFLFCRFQFFLDFKSIRYLKERVHERMLPSQVSQVPLHCYLRLKGQ